MRIFIICVQGTHAYSLHHGRISYSEGGDGWGKLPPRPPKEREKEEDKGIQKEKEKDRDEVGGRGVAIIILRL